MTELGQNEIEFDEIDFDEAIKLDHIPDAKECRQLLAKFKRDQYWPDVVHVNDHGNVDLLRLTTRGARIVQSWV